MATMQVLGQILQVLLPKSPGYCGQENLLDWAASETTPLLLQKRRPLSWLESFRMGQTLFNGHERSKKMKKKKKKKTKRGSNKLTVEKRKNGPPMTNVFDDAGIRSSDGCCLFCDFQVPCFPFVKQERTIKRDLTPRHGLSSLQTREWHCKNESTATSDGKHK